MADLVMRKRPAMHQGEMGLFIDTQVFEEEFASIKQDVDVSVEAKQSRNLKQMRLAWGLCRKIADSGALGDADTREVMNYLLKKAKHVKYIANQHRDGVEVEVIVKSIRFAAMEQTAFDRLFNRMLYIVTSEIIPEMPIGELRDLVEKLAGVETPEQEQKPAPKRRGRPPNPKPVSIIPDHDPVTGEITEILAADPVIPPAGTISETVDVASPAPATSAPPAPPSPAAIGGPAGSAPIKPPTTVETWKVWAMAWLTEVKNDPAVNDIDIMTRWSAEKNIRNACGCTADDRQPVFAYLSKIVEAKREAEAKRP